MKITLKILITVVSAFCLTNSLDAGWNVHPGGLTTRLEYFDFSERDAGGNPIYNHGQTVHYRITIINSANKNYRNLPVEASLKFVNSVTCTRTWSDMQMVSNAADELLPDNSISGPHLLTIAGGSYSFFDGFYTIPNTVCPNSVRVILDAGKSNKASEPMVMPNTFVIR